MGGETMANMKNAKKKIKVIAKKKKITTNLKQVCVLQLKT